MFRVVLSFLLLGTTALGLSIGTDDSGDVEVVETDQEWAEGSDDSEEDAEPTKEEDWIGATDNSDDMFNFDDMSFHHKKFQDPRTKIAPDSSPFYSVTQAKRFKLAYGEFMTHPIMERYFAHNHKLAVVPAKEVQQELLEKVLPQLSPYGKLSMIQITLPEGYAGPDAEAMRFHRTRQEQSTGKVQKVQAYLNGLADRFKCVHDYFEVILKNDKTLHDNFIHPYAGLQFWLSLNSNDTEVRETVFKHVSNILADIARSGVYDLDALSKPAYQYLPVLMDSLFVFSKERKQVTVGDVGKNIIVGNQHSSMSGWVDFKAEEPEGERCQVNHYNLVDEADAYSSEGTAALVNRKIMQSWAPVWQRFNFMMFELRKQYGKVALEHLDASLGDFTAVNQACKVVSNAKRGFGKTWEKRCMLASETLEYLEKKARSADANNDGELSFEETLPLNADIKRVFAVTAPNTHVEKTDSAGSLFQWR